MSSRSIAITIKFLATCATLLGLWMLYFVFARELPASIAAGNAWRIVLCLFDILLGGYFSFVGFLAWFRFSPRALRHVLTILALVLLWTIGGMLDWAPHTSPYAFLGVAVSCYLFYRLAYFYFRSQLFQDANAS